MIGFLALNNLKKAVFVFLIGELVLGGCSPSVSSSSDQILMLSDTVRMGNVVVFNEGFSREGNTSVANDSSVSIKWSGESVEETGGFGYFTKEGHEVAYLKRNRDLGQIFTYPDSLSAKQLKSVTVRLGFGSNVVREGMYGQNISLQFLKVIGNGTLNNNGSDSTMSALHGFPHNRYSEAIAHHRDDYYEGLEFKSIEVFSGYQFPLKKDFGFDNDTVAVSPDHPDLKGKFLQYIVPETSDIILEPGKRYAFMLMIDEIGEDRGFTLANWSVGSYAGGHGIRREGNGQFPPVPFDPSKLLSDSANELAVKSAFLSSDFKERINLMPGTNGYPDVCTYRDHVFYIETD